MWVSKSLSTALTPTAIALGNFDGLHRGHQQVISPILHRAVQPATIAAAQAQPSIARQKPLNWQNSRLGSCKSLKANDRPEEPYSPSVLPSGVHSTVVTFYPHPQQFFTGITRTLLTPLDEKIALLREIGVQQLVLLPFNNDIASLTPREFVEKILVRELAAKQISVGQNFRFGYKRTGTTEELKSIAWEYGVKVTIVPLEICQEERISSSQIRCYLEAGNVKAANRLLGRSYSLMGTVITGQKLGRTLGFPTANIQLNQEKFLPKTGVYAVQVWLENSDSNSKPIPGVMNIGMRPTVAGVKLTTEVHLLDWSGDLYGQNITVTLEEYLRTEEKFPSLDALKQQIQADCNLAKKILQM
ncbi:bifunctional riboflavin kinase/FAD synthetase [Ancylothrix sp. C2]|uniref:bifunctional riboflavin kinase/FAD synthetase n=1 Tax=Ancylothrix sp. D3o TaxID=2953691 RepID=UPI0021BAE6A0|nr:bifunctional riboflavin kinase/FAD synthetase [Ancylothrix sp. D3o]MCT7948576.1 bifunctional riboflavin kinase/FAD synthetase [Ancylothrix sp. D3o]